MFLAAPGWAVERTLENVGSNAEANGKALKTLVETTAQTGDTIIIPDGTYQLPSCLKIDKNLIIKAASGAHPTLERNLPSAQTNGEVIYVIDPATSVTSWPGNFETDSVLHLGLTAAFFRQRTRPWPLNAEPPTSVPFSVKLSVPR